MEDIERLDQHIRAVARRYARSKSDIDDLVQIGKIAAWKRMHSDPGASDSYYVQQAQWAISNFQKRWRAQKRKPTGGIVSYHQPLSGDSDTLLVDTLQGPDLSRDAVTTQTMKEVLVEQLGPDYVKAMRRHRRSKSLARNVVRTLIEDIAQIPFEEIPSRVDYGLFVEHGMQQFLWVFYDNSPFRAVQHAYSEEFIPWEFRKLPNNFWRGSSGMHNALDALVWFSEKQGLDSIEDCSRITRRDFMDNGLGGMLQILFNDSPNLALKQLFPDLLPWQSNYVTQGFYDEPTNQKSALVWYLNEHGVPSLDTLTAEETYEHGLRRFVSKRSFNSLGLRGLVSRHQNSPYDLLSTFYPEQILPWTLANVKKVWRDEPHLTAAKAVRWLFDRYLQIPTTDIPRYATNSLFWRVGFSGILTNRSIGFNSSTFAAIDNAYPGMYLPDDFSSSRKTTQVLTTDLRR